MRLFLVVQNEGKQKGMKIPASVLPFFIGRDPECHLRPASPIISKKHCGFSQEGTQFFLEDFGSTNGTIFRGERLSGKTSISSGDRVVVGPLEFDVLIETAVEAVAPAPVAAAPAANATPATLAPKPAAPTSAAPAPKPAVAPASAPVKPAAPTAKPAAAPLAPAAKANPTPAAKATPAPAAAAKPTAAEAAATAATAANAFDDDIAALLLGGDGMGSGEHLASDGTTVIDLMNTDTTPTPPAGTPINPADSKAANARPPIGNTTEAAKALLEKYMRRPRAT